MNTETTELSPAAEGRAPKRGLVGKIFDWRPSRVWHKSLIVIVLVLPLIVAVTYMWSMWDPSHYLRDVKIALVNQDEGTEHNGEKVNYGEQVADGLKETDYLNITELPSADAENGLRDGHYMFVVDIPDNFSQDIVSVIEEHPQQAQVNINYNDYVGTNQPLLTSALVPLIQHGVAASISEGYGEQILDGMNQLSDGLREAADGSVQLDDGATLLHDGTTQGVDGAQQLRDGAAQLKDGTSQLRDGMNQLRGGTGQLGDGMVQIDDGVGQLTGMLIPLIKQVQQLTPALSQTVEFMDRVGLGDRAAKVRETIAMLDSTNPENLAAQLEKLKAGTAEVRYNLNDPSSPYLSGVIKLQDGSVQLDDGMAQLYDGTQQLYDGTLQLNDGTGQLKDGTGQLRTGLTDGAAKAPSIAHVDQSAKQIAAPVAFVEDNLHPVQTLVNPADPSEKQLSDGVSMILTLTFGFMLMAVASLLAPNVSRKARQKRPLLSVARVCGLLTAVNFLLLLGLSWVSSQFGWSPQNKLALGATLLVMAFSAAALFQAFRSIFGRLVGGLFSFGVVGYGALVYGGIWPLDITPPFLRVFHWFSPMSYARYAFMGSVDNIISSRFWIGLLGLLAIGVVSLGISLLLRWMRFRGRIPERSDLLNFDREVEAKSREKARSKAAGKAQPAHAG